MKQLHLFVFLFFFLMPLVLIAQIAGTALQFNGVNNYVQIPKTSQWDFGQSSFTISAWFKTNAGGYRNIIRYDGSSGGLWLVRLNPSNKIEFLLGDPNQIILETPLTYTDDQWHHLAAVRNSTNDMMKLFIDGNLVVSNSGQGVKNIIGASDAILAIGAAASWNAEYFQGSIDEVSIWNTSRTQTEIRETMYHQLTGSENGLISNWSFDENGNIYAYDIKSGNTGTLVNSPEWVTSTIPFASSSSTRIVSLASEINFTGSSLFATFQSKIGTDTIVATKIPNTLQGTNPNGVTTLHTGYWIVQSTNNGLFNADLTFGLGAGALNIADQENTSNIKLYRRAVGSTGSWTLVGSANKASFGSVTFEGISSFGEFAIGTSTASTLAGTGGVFQSTTSGAWDDPANWYLIGGSDEDGIPDANDDVIIRAGENVQCVSSYAYCNNLLLLGASTGTRLTLGSGIGFYMTGVLNSDATSLSHNLIVTEPSSNFNFNGSSRQAIGNKWGGDVAGWTMNFNLNGGDTATVLTDFKAGYVGVNSCMLRVGSYDSPKNLYIDGGTENSGTLTLNSATLFISGNITRDNTFTSRFSSFSTVYSSVEIGGIYLSAEKIRIGWTEYYWSNPSTLRVRSSSGLLINTSSYTQYGTLEYIGTSAQTSGNELTSYHADVNIKNPAGVQFLTNTTISNLYLDSGNVNLSPDVTLTATNLYAKSYEIHGLGNVQIDGRIETAHTNGLAGLFQNTGMILLNNTWSSTIVYNGITSQHTGTLRLYVKDCPSQYISFVVDNPAGVMLNGSYYGNSITLTQGNITVNSPDTLLMNSVIANTNEIKGTGMFIQKPGTFNTSHANGIDGTIRTANYLFESPNENYITFSGTVPQISGLKLPDSLASISLQNNSGFTLSKSLYLPNFDLNSQYCDVNLPSGVSLRTPNFNGGSTRKINGGGNFVLTKGGSFTTQNSGGINGTLQLIGTISLGDSSSISFGEASAAQATGTLLPDTVQNLYFSNSSGTILSKHVQVRNFLGISSGLLDNSSNNVTMWDGSTIQRDGGSVAALPKFQHYYDVTYAGWSGSTGPEIPDSSTVLRNFSGGNWITLSKNITVNGTLTNYVHTGSFFISVLGDISSNYMVAGHLSRYVSAAKEYSWEIADSAAQRYHPFFLNVTALQNSGDVTMTLLDTAVAPISVFPTGQKFLTYYYKAEQNKISNLNGTISVYYNDGDVNAAGIPDDDSLRVMQLKNNSWIYLDGISRDKVNNKITVGPIDTLTTFIIVGTGEKGIVQLSTKEINFGDVVQPNIKYDSLYIMNTGTWPLQIYSASLSPDYWTFGISPTTATIPIGDSVKFTVWMNAANIGTETKIFFGHNGTTGVDTVVLKGRSIYPELTVSNYYPSFGTIPLGTSKNDSVMIYNKGTYQLIITSLASNSQDFSATLEKDTIAVADSGKLYVTFSPQTEGTFNGDIIIYNNIYNSGPNYSIHPSGIATASQFVATPEQLNFGNVHRGSSKTDSVLVKNFGIAILHVTNIISTVNGYLVSPTTADISVGGSLWFKITFAPPSAGNLDGDIIFHHSATTSPDSVHVTGTGVEPIFSSDKASFNFQAVRVGTTKTDSLFVTNNGNAVLNIISILSSDSTQFMVSPKFATVNPNEKQKFMFVFKPLFMETQNGIIKFKHDGNPDTNIVSVTGFGQLPIFTATRRVVNFGDVKIDSTRTDTITISNTGNTSLAVTTVAINDSQFTVSPSSVILSPGGKKIFTLSFTPRTNGIKKGALVFTHSGNTSPDTISLQGNGKVTSILDEQNEIPTTFSLSQNFPNPFNPSTTIRFGVPEPSSVKITVYDILGRRVEELFNEQIKAGYKLVVWNASVSSGMYFYRIESSSISNPKNKFVQVRKMLIIK